MDNTIRRVLLLCRKYDLSFDQLSVTFNGDLGLMVICNDVFWWGCADAEAITEENIDRLEDTFEIINSIDPYLVDDAFLIWVARERGMRPQGAVYSLFDEALWPTLNDCGPEREIGLGNPYKPGEYK